MIYKVGEMKLIQKLICTFLFKITIIYVVIPHHCTAQLCCYNQDSLSGFTNLLNTFYPTQNNITLNSGDTSLVLGAVPSTDVFGNSFGNVPIQSGDLILIIQMQGASFQYDDSRSYGSGQVNSGSDALGGTGYTNLNQTGHYEWVIALNAVPLTGGILRINSACAGRQGLFNSYKNSDATSVAPRSRFQVVRVPRFTNLKLTGNLVTTAWNDRVGGILALDVADTLNFNGFGITANEKGFRGGYQPVRPSGGNVTIFTTTNGNLSSGKGEGVCGSPRYVWNGVNEVDYGSSWVGYPGGVYGRGAPGNAGGGGNTHNAGGGGGGNGGTGGVGGYATSGSFSETGGRPGGSFPLFNNRIFLGGGGGGGDANNATSGVKGGSGGGIVYLKSRVLEGAGFVRTNGGQGQPGGLGAAPDGSGGGGAGGTIVVLAQEQTPGLALTLEAKGGNGGHVLGADHGPGGGGGGGQIFFEGSGVGVTTDVSAGIRGLTNHGSGIPYGATSGQSGLVNLNLLANLPPHLSITSFPKPIAIWRADTVCLGDTTNFVNQSFISHPSVISGYNWDFGDGNTSQIPSPRHRYASAGNYQVTLRITSIHGCADTVQGWVRVLQTPSRTLNRQVCDSLVWHGQILRQSGQYSRFIPALLGCDTLEQLQLLVLPQGGGILPDAHFFNTGRNATGGVLAGGQPDLQWEVAVNNLFGPYQPAIVMNGIPGVYYSSPWPDATWISYTSSGLHSAEIDLFFRCRFQLPCTGVCSVPINIDSSFCLGLDYFSDNSVFEIFINGVPQSGFMTNLPVSNPYYHIGYQQLGRLSANLCRNWLGGLNEIVVHIKSGPNYVGFLAQSSVTLPPPPVGVTFSSIGIDICSSNPYVFNGTPLTQTGVYRDTLVNSRGCDSVITLNLSVYQPTASTLSQSICSPNPYVFNGTSLTQTGVYRDTLVNFRGCDSVVTLNLTVLPTSSSSMSQSICSPNPYVFNGTPLTQTGVYRDTLPSYHGCDSVITLNLQVNEPSSYSFADTICRPNSYTFGGLILSQAGIYRDTLVNQSGCDSLITLNLRISQPDSTRLSQIACDSLNWNGQIYRQSGQYVQSSLGSDGCDSVSILQLTVRRSSSRNMTESTCDSLLWNGAWYRQTGTYFYRTLNAVGCDSLEQLDLTIHTTPEPPLTFDTTICIKDGSIVGYPWPLIHSLNWYRYPGDLQPFHSGSTCVIPWKFDSTYLYIAHQESGCESPRIAVRIINDEQTSFPIRPTAFTPNNDGVNDQWFCESRNDLFLQVFDRWGRLLHEDSGKRVTWDGGQYTPGAYPYIVRMRSCGGKDKYTSGIITLSR